MQRYGLTLDLRDEPAAIARYEQEHQRVWPAVVARLRDVGISEMRIYRFATHLFMYCETNDGFDPATDFARCADDPTYKEWDELMRTMQVQVPGTKPGEWWAMMAPVFDLNWPQHRPGAAPR